MKITLCEMGGIEGRGGRGMNYGTISRQQLAQLAATPSGLDAAQSLGACLLLLVAQQLSLIHYTSVDSNTLNVFLCADWWNLYGFAACSVN